MSDAEKPAPQEIAALEALFAARRYGEVATLAEALTARFPLYGSGWKVLGVALKQTGRDSEALAPLQKAATLLPDDAVAHYNLGVALMEQGRLDEAAACYRRAVQLRPDYPEAHCNLGVIFKEQRRFGEAEASYRQALRVNPGYALVHSNLGTVLKELLRYDEAEASCRRALEIKPDFAEAHSNLGATLLELGRQHEAEASHRRAIEIKPHLPQAHNNLGVALLEQGRTDEARASLQRALEIQPDYAEAHFNLSAITDYKSDDPRIAQMLALMAKPDLSALDRRWLSFALGKAYEDTGDAASSFGHLLQGNRLRKKELGYCMDSDRKLFALIKSLFGAGRSPAHAGPQDSAGCGTRPIFIVGMPRSGTTLVEQILASHSQVHGSGELEILNWIVGPVLEDMEKTRQDRLTIATVNAVRDGYLAGLKRVGSSSPCVTDKMPGNFRWIGFILTALPEAKIVHVQRDAAATCWSAYKHCFSGTGNGYACDLVDVAEYYKLYADLMVFWQQKFPRRIYHLNYQALTENQERESRELLDYCGLGWEDACLEFNRTRRSIRSASYIQVRKKMYQGSSEAWRKYAAYLQPMLDVLKPKN